MVSPHETMTAPSASLAILPVSIEICVDPIWAVTFCCIIFPGCELQAGHPDCRFQLRSYRSKLKPKFKVVTAAWYSLVVLFLRRASNAENAGRELPERFPV